MIWLPGGNVDCRGLLPLNPTAVEVLCPSVYAPTGWVTQPLTMPEMFHAFDIPPSAIPPKTSVAGPCWQQTPPSKILQRAYLQWATDSLVTFLVPPIVHTKKTPLSMYRATGAIDLDSSFLSAIKADGADIPVFLWDDRIWSRGAHSESRVSKFKAKWEGRSPLDALRMGLLRHWRGRVRRSLIRYLKATYGADWSSNSAAKKEGLHPFLLEVAFIPEVACNRGASELVAWRAPDLQASTEART